MQEFYEYEDYSVLHHSPDRTQLKRFLTSKGFFPEHHERSITYRFDITTNKKLIVGIYESVGMFDLHLCQTIFRDQFMDNESFKKVMKRLLKPYNVWQKDFDELNIGCENHEIDIEKQRHFLQMVGFEPFNNQGVLRMHVYDDMLLLVTFDDNKQRYTVEDVFSVDANYLDDQEYIERTVKKTMKEHGVDRVGDYLTQAEEVI